MVVTVARMLVLVVNITKLILNLAAIGHPNWFCDRGDDQGFERVWVYRGAGSGGAVSSAHTPVQS